VSLSVVIKDGPPLQMCKLVTRFRNKQFLSVDFFFPREIELKGSLHWYRTTMGLKYGAEIQEI